VFTVLSALVALACSIASAWRLVWAFDATGLDPKLLRDALRAEGGDSLGRELRRAFAPWIAALLGATEQPPGAARDTLIDEQVLELDWRLSRGSRVPRGCARIASSSGFLFASLALVRALSAATEDVNAALTSALDSFSVGLAGTSFCIAVHMRARRLLREMRADAARLVEWARSAQGTAG
jgi:hypothetical protein